MAGSADAGIRAAQLGILINTVLAVTKLLAGVIGNSYALIADAIESGTDIFSSLIVLSGLRIARREPTAEYPFGYGRAESLATAVVSLMLLGAGVGIAVESVREILTPHHLPAPWTLFVLAAVVLIKWWVSRRVHAASIVTGSTAVEADSWHHLSDALTSAAAFMGISIALWGGKGWEAADDWAALVAVLIIVYNGCSILWTALRDLMDAAPEEQVIKQIRQIAETVPDVLAVEKILVRKSGPQYHIAIHVQSDPSMSLEVAHAVGGRVKATIRNALPRVGAVLVHMEPFVTSIEVKSP